MTDDEIEIGMRVIVIDPDGYMDTKEQKGTILRKSGKYGDLQYWRIAFDELTENGFPASRLVKLEEQPYNEQAQRFRDWLENPNA